RPHPPQAHAHRGRSPAGQRSVAHRLRPHRSAPRGCRRVAVPGALRGAAAHRELPVLRRAGADGIGHLAVSEFLALERAALRRCLDRAAVIALGLFAAEVGGLALYTAVARLRAVLSEGTAEQWSASFGALLLGAELAFVLSSMGVGLGAVALARP